MKMSYDKIAYDNKAYEVVGLNIYIQGEMEKGGELQVLGLNF